MIDIFWGLLLKAMELPELDDSAFRDLSNHLRNRKSGGLYGLNKNEFSRPSIVDPKLYHLLMKFALVNVTIPFTTIRINGKPPKKCKEYYVVGFGSYTGGEMKIANRNYDIWHRPLIVREGAEALPASGKKWTLTFYSVETTKKLDDYEAVVVDDKWLIAQRRDGQPPLYLMVEKRMRKIKEEDEEEEEEGDSNMTDAQNLMIRAMSLRAPPSAPPLTHI